MSLRRKILILISLALLALVAGMYAIASRILLEGFGWLEDRDARLSVRRVVNALQDELQTLTSKAADWAVWDDAYQFVQKRDPEFIHANCSDPTFVDLRLDALVFLNRDGQVVYSKGYSRQSKSEVPVAASLLAQFGPRSPLLQHPSLDSVKAGILLLPEGPLMLVARPVLTSERKGPSAGTVVFGRYLDSREIGRLASQTQSSFELIRTDTGQLPAEIQAARAELIGRTKVHIQPVSSSLLAGYAVLRDLTGKRSLLVRVNIPRDIHTQGQITISYLVSALLVAGLVIGVLAIGLLEGLVLGRLARVIGEVRAIGASGNFGARLAATNRSDELGGLVVALNRMLEALDHSHRQLAESQRQLATLMSNLPGMVYRCRNDRHRTMEFVSQGTEQLTGHKPEALTSHQVNYGQLIHPEDRDRVWDQIQAALLTRKPFQASYRVQSGDGQLRQVWETGRGVFDPAGQLVALEGYIGDVTEHRDAETQLRLQSAALESAANAIVISDRQGRILWVNSAFVQLTGYSAAEVIGQQPSLLKSGKQDNAFYAEMWRTISTGQVWRGELVNRRKDGRLYTERMNITPVRDRTGAISHFIAIKEDVTEHHRLQEQFLQSQKMEAVGRLAGGVAHDFNNMLTAIMGYSELILRQLHEDSPLRRNASEIEKAAYRAAKLTRQLLAFSRKQVLQPRVLDLNQVFLDMEKMLRRLVPENIELRHQLAPDLGRVKADPGQIEQVILNLTVNARDAMPQGGSLTVTTSNASLPPGADLVPGPYVVLAVRDTGIGMSPEIQQHLFEPFFTTKGQNSGTGLGLATSYGIVKQSGGHILVESQPGAGSKFSVYLPRIDQPAEPEPQANQPTTMPTGQETVLLVEDEETVRELAAVVLAELGYRVLSASNGRDALELAERAGVERIDLLLTDMVMPQMDGKQLAETLRLRRPTLRILFCSGYSEDAIVQHRVLERGVAFLQKPYSPGALARKVRDLLDV